MFRKLNSIHRMIFKSGLYWSLLLFVLLPIAAFGQTVSLDAGTDRMGGDYKSFELAGPDPELCQQACANDAACKAYTYVKPGVKGRRAVCFLKSSVPPSTPNECCTSGARAAGGRPGPIIRPRPPLPPDPEVAFVIPTPSTVTVTSEFSDHSDHRVRWQWDSRGCFPGGAGRPAPPCPWINDIEGFRVYSTKGGLLQDIKDPTFRETALRSSEVGKCYVVTAFKGENESAPSPMGCVDAPAKPLYKISSVIPTPGNVRLARDAAECAAATGEIVLWCNAMIKSNAQLLVWNYQGSGIDGFRLYDAVNGLPYVKKSEANANIRVFAVQPRSGLVLSDYCFTVRAYKGDIESLPSNPVCLTPKAVPVKPMLVIGPSSGISAVGVNLLKNQNSGCPFAQSYSEVRSTSDLTDRMAVYWMHKDSSLCGKREVLWNEGSIMFPLDAIPADFKSAELRFTSNGSVAFLGTDGPHGNKPTFNVNCIQSIHAYHIDLRDNSQREAYQFGPPDAWFSWINEELVANETLPNQTNRIDVTWLVRKSLAAAGKGSGKPELGFVFEVNKNMVGDNDKCMTSYEGFALEVKPKQ